MSKSHGYTVRPRVYNIWANMKQRCLNANNSRYKDYGGRGISVCERWMEFENFLTDMGEPPSNWTLERINNDGNYEAGNCEWIPPKVQQRNRRLPSNVEDLTGKRFGRYTILRRVPGRDKCRNTLWEGRCDCGTIKILSRRNFVRPYIRNTISCGCHRKDVQSKRMTAHWAAYRAAKAQKEI